MRKLAPILLSGLLLTFFVPLAATAQTIEIRHDPDLEQRISALESKVRSVQRNLDGTSEGLVLFLFGFFCALWAQNTGRSAWLWFFLGLIFSVLTVLLLLYLNSRHRGTPSSMAPA